MDTKRAFELIAQASVKAGLLTSQDVAMIARAGTRKAGYWSRHLRDLLALLQQRVVERGR